MSSKERLPKRQSVIKPLVEDYFAWVKEILADAAVLPKGKTADGLKYSLNQEKYLKVFLDNPDVPQYSKWRQFKCLGVQYFRDRKAE